MFEQSIVATQQQNKTWTLGISMLAQIGFVSAAVLFPLVYTDMLPGFSMWGHSIVAPLPPAAAPPPSQQQLQRATQSTMTERPVFREPKIPTTVSTRPDEPAIVPYETGVVGSPGQSNGANPLDRVLS